MFRVPVERVVMKTLHGHRSLKQVAWATCLSGETVHSGGMVDTQRYRGVMYD